MRYLLESQHHDFFAKQGYIAFGDLFTEKALQEAEKAVVENARDLWRINPAVEALTTNKTCAEIAMNLTFSTCIRLAYDEGLYTSDSNIFPKAPCSLEDISCVHPVLCGMLVRLTAGPMPNEAVVYCPCPQKRGDALFFSGKMLALLSPLFSIPEQKFLLIAYGGKQLQYLCNLKDKFLNSLKAKGYGFGDHLKIATHPILFSR